MEGCHVIIFISQNPNPNFLFSFHHHASRRRTSSPRRPPLHHHHTIAGDAPATTAPPTAATVTISILFRASTNAHPTCTMPATTSLPSSSPENADAPHTHRSMAAASTLLARPAQFRHASNLHHRFLVRSATIATPFPSSRERSATSRAAHLHFFSIIFSPVPSRLHITTLHCRSAKHFAGAPTPPATLSVRAPVFAGKEAPRRSSRAVTREGEECERETLVLERDTLRHVSASDRTVKLVNWSTLVNWSKSAVNSGQNCKYG